QLSAQRSSMVAVGEEAVVRHLHGDRAEPLPNSARAQIPRDRAKNSIPIQSVVLIEPAILGRDECLSHELGNDRDRYIDPTNILEVAKEFLVAVVDVPAFARMERTNLGRAWAA